MAARVLGTPHGSVTVWRIVAAHLAERAFDGEGAHRFGGRWNHPGTTVVYTSGSLSLAALETFVHLDPDIAPDELVSISAEIPEDLSWTRFEVADLPRDWRAYPAPATLQEVGSGWAREGLTAALSVPSAIVPTERNVLLNPGHLRFSEIRIGQPEAFAFDPRMWK